MQITKHFLKPNGKIPNSIYPLMIFRGAFTDKTSDQIESIVQSNGWNPRWRYPMYKQSHYHSTTHEFLAVYQGSADLLFGTSDDNLSSPNAVKELVKAGDGILIAAGISHRAWEDRDGFRMVGSYPKESKPWDMCYGGEKVLEGLGIPPHPLGGRLKEWEEVEK